MKTYIALLRGINVGGHGKLPMKDLAQLLKKLGCQCVETYIQSGNAVFRSANADPADLARQLAAAIEKQAGFRPRVLVLDTKVLESAVRANPFAQAEADPARLHLYFLASKPAAPNLDAIEKARSAREQYALKGGVFYLLTPDGAGKSKLAAKAEKWLGVDATARNWRTVRTLIEMARALR